MKLCEEGEFADPWERVIGDYTGEASHSIIPPCTHGFS